MVNILCAIRSLQEPQILQKSINDYNLRLLTASDEEKEMLEKKMMIASRMHKIKSQYNAYSEFIEHCLISNSWHVSFKLSFDGSFEDVLYSADNKDMNMYVILSSRFEVEGKTPVFFIQLDANGPIEYGLYDRTQHRIYSSTAEAIFEAIESHMSYNIKLMSALPTYKYKCLESIPIEVPEDGILRNANEVLAEAVCKKVKLYYGTSLENHNNIINSGIPADLVSDNYETALYMARSEAGESGKGTIVYELHTEMENLGRPMTMSDVSGNVSATLYMLKEGITDICCMKLIYKSADTVAEIKEATKTTTKRKIKKNKHNLENQLSFWS